MSSARVKSKLVGRPSLMLPPSFAAVEEEGGIAISKMEYNFYHPLKKNNPSLKKDMVKDEEILRFDSNGGKEEVALMKDKDTTLVGSSHGWLALFNKNNRSMSLINPVSGRSIPLPPLVGEPFLDEETTLKVILSHSPTDKKCRALVIHSSFDRAAVCSPGRSEKWSPLGNKPSRGRYNDFVYSASRKAFVGVKQVTRGWLGLGWPTEELEFWDVESTMEAPVKTARAPPTPHAKYLALVWQTYLVSEEESGQLFMVRRYLTHYKKRVDYDVFIFESYFGGEDVQLCSLLDDLVVMFIGVNHCFAVKPSRFPEYRPNCIYFSGGWNWKNGKQNKPFADVYHYKNALYYSDREYSQLFYGNDFPFNHNLPWFTLTQDKD